MVTRNKLMLCALFLAFIGYSLAQDEKRKLSIELKARDSYFIMEPMICEVTLKNVGKHTVPEFYRSLAVTEPYKFVVKNKKGQLLSPTSFGKRIERRAENARRSPVFNYSGPLDPTLYPGASFTERLAANQYVDMTDIYAEGNDEFDIYIERLGVRSNTVHVRLKIPLYDVENWEVANDFSWRMKKISDAHKKKAQEAARNSKK